MTKALNKSVAELVTSSGLNDFDQRSALGIARSSVEPNAKPYEGAVAVKHLMKGRDELALRLIAVLDGVKRDEAVAALAHARSLINAPYLDATMLGFRAAREEVGTARFEKKAKKEK